MDLALSEEERGELEAAAAGEPRARAWRRYRAVLMLAGGARPAAIARALGCSPSSVSNGAAAWDRAGVAGLREGPHPGRQRRLGAEGERRLEAALAADPQARGHRATGWTAPLLRGELAKAGHEASERTVRRAPHRLGWRRKRPRFVLGRPDPASEHKKGPSPSGRA